MRRKQKVYFVIGMCEEEFQSPYFICSQYAAHSSLKRAEEELQNIIRECNEEMREMEDPDVEVEWDTQGRGMTITFPNGSMEHYRIYEREINFEPETITM